MHKNIIHLTTITILTIAAFISSIPTSAAEQKKPDAAEKEKPGRLPFSGKIGAVDNVSKSITLAGKEKNRVIHVTSETKIMKAGKPATFDDAKVGEEVGGQLRKTADGKEEAISLRVGPKPEETPKKEGKEKKQKN